MLRLESTRWLTWAGRSNCHGLQSKETKLDVLRIHRVLSCMSDVSTPIRLDGIEAEGMLSSLADGIPTSLASSG